MATPKTIVLAGPFVQKEVVATGTITPGHLIGVSAVHAVADGNAAKRFALEERIVGNGIDDDYSSGDTVLYGVFQRGAEVYAFLDNGENVAAGAALSSAGNGNLQAVTAAAATSQAQRDGIVAYALEAVNASGGTARIKVEIA
jgi:hypothetical protein